MGLPKAFWSMQDALVEGILRTGVDGQGLPFLRPLAERANRLLTKSSGTRGADTSETDALQLDVAAKVGAVPHEGAMSLRHVPLMYDFLMHLCHRLMRL